MTMPPRSPDHQILPIDRYIGVATQFERVDCGYLFRDMGSGPAIRVGNGERDAFVNNARRSAAMHLGVMAVVGWAACLVVGRMMSGWHPTFIAIGNGVALSLVAMALYASMQWHAGAPARDLAGRAIEQPARDPYYGERLGYIAIVVLTVCLLLLAALGTRTPSSDYVTFATISLILGFYLTVDRWRFLASLEPARRMDVKAQERKRNRQLAVEAPSGWTFLAVLAFVLIEMIIGALVLGGGLTIAAATAGSSIEQLPGLSAVIAIALSLIVAGLLIWPIERLCRWLTGMSAIDAFDFLPAGW